MKLLFYMISFIVICDGFEFSDYKKKRDELLRLESTQALGGDILLTDKESDVNNCLMQHKFREVDQGFRDPTSYSFSEHFFSFKNKIRRSKVYHIIKDMPKGAVLHVHDMAILSADYLLNITYMEHLYVCFEENNVQFRFSNKIPEIKCTSQWQLMSTARNSTENITRFDSELIKHFSLVVDDPDEAYPTIKESWSKFIDYFVTVGQLVTYMPLWEQYFYDVLMKFEKNNVMYVEVRSVLPNLYDLDGTVYDEIVTAKVYKKAINKFMKKHSNFVGAKIIYAPSRHVSMTKISDYLKIAKILKQNVSDVFAGFDLVGQEDLGNPLIQFVPQLVEAGRDLNYFFHAGETDWYGTLTDENLVDAVLLGAKRIGHAYALPKHPLLMEEVIKRGIGLEVNVISNAVLSLVRDLRNHPLSTFLARGLPVVLSSDDPGAWGADVISDDFYVAFVGVASRLSDIRMLKKLALNSLEYSTLEAEKKSEAMKKFNRKWNEFISNFNCSRY